MNRMQALEAFQEMTAAEQGVRQALEAFQAASEHGIKCPTNIADKLRIVHQVALDELQMLKEEIFGI